MPFLTMHDKGGYLAFDEAECVAAGKLLQEQYSDEAPFPHIVIDDFLDAEMLRNVANGYPSRDGKLYFDRPQERLKYQYHAGETTNAITRNLLSELNSRAFLGFLRHLTNIRGLIADSYFEGGGLHETRAGGHLSVHADFNVHGKMKVERRLNLLIYLNDEWSSDYGGDLELWDNNMTRAVQSISPILGRAVIFNTAGDSYHGQPEPVNCPEDRSRKSIATYYYTAFDNIGAVAQRTTNFKSRPFSDDKPDRRIAFQHFVKDWVPFKLQRFALKLNPFK